MGEGIQRCCSVLPCLGSAQTHQMSPEISGRLIAGEVGLPSFLSVHQTVAAAPFAKVWGKGVGIFAPASHVFLQAGFADRT